MIYQTRIYHRSFVNFRLCNSHLPVEKGRWMGLERNDRKCYLCNLNDIGDECHNILKCPYFNCERNKFIPHVNKNIANIYIFKKIMTDINLDNMINLGIFGLRPQTQPIYSFGIGVPKWPLFL